MADPDHITEHFLWSEAQCHDGQPVPPELRTNAIHVATQVEVLRAELSESIEVISWYRDPHYNGTVVNAAGHSQHRLAKAIDLCVADYSPQDVYDAIEDLIAEHKMEQGGLGLYLPSATRERGWVHYDVRGVHARWVG